MPLPSDTLDDVKDLPNEGWQIGWDGETGREYPIESRIVQFEKKLEEYYDKEIHHGRLYPNLDRLVELGLVEKGKHDGRTNAYRLAEDGAGLLADLGSWLSRATEDPCVQRYSGCCYKLIASRRQEL